VGLPAILVPYPHATRDHQAMNARPLAGTGAAVIVPDGGADADRIGSIAEEILGDEDRLTKMSSAAKALARPSAADDLAAWVLELVSR
jgi:UDP-N-acetylglucosamine--N-acetylmuramyl-(pentapeptide) pyrophosphoryl-undecaprenol N-acetylglucosamine transferase